MPREMPRFRRRRPFTSVSTGPATYATDRLQPARAPGPNGRRSGRPGPGPSDSMKRPRRSSGPESAPRPRPRPGGGPGRPRKTLPPRRVPGRPSGGCAGGGRMPARSAGVMRLGRMPITGMGACSPSSGTVDPDGQRQKERSPRRNSATTALASSPAVRCSSASAGSSVWTRYRSSKTTTTTAGAPVAARSSKDGAWMNSTGPPLVFRQPGGGGIPMENMAWISWRSSVSSGAEPASTTFPATGSTATTPNPGSPGGASTRRTTRTRFTSGALRPASRQLRHRSTSNSAVVEPASSPSGMNQR